MGTTKVDIDAGIVDDLGIDVIGTTDVDVGTTIDTTLTADMALDITEIEDNDGTTALPLISKLIALNLRYLD